MIKNPPKGGIPLLEKIRKAKRSARAESICFSSENEARCIVERSIIRRINHLTKELTIYTAR